MSGFDDRRRMRRIGRNSGRVHRSAPRASRPMDTVVRRTANDAGTPAREARGAPRDDRLRRALLRADLQPCGTSGLSEGGSAPARLRAEPRRCRAGTTAARAGARDLDRDSATLSRHSRAGPMAPRTRGGVRSGPWAGPTLLDPDPAAAKAALRREILARRDALDPAARARLSAAALERTQALDAFRRARAVLGYASFGSELDTRPLPSAGAGQRPDARPAARRSRRPAPRAPRGPGSRHGAPARDVGHSRSPLRRAAAWWRPPRSTSSSCPASSSIRTAAASATEPATTTGSWRPGRSPCRRSWRRRSSSRSSRRCRSSPRDRRVDLVVTESRTYSKLRLEPTEDP